MKKKRHDKQDYCDEQDQQRNNIGKMKEKKDMTNKIIVVNETNTIWPRQQDQTY